MRTTSHHRTRTALAVLVVPLLLLGLLPGTASADVDDRDPERVVPAAPPAQTPSARGARAQLAASATIDSDVYAYTLSATGKTYFVLAGHLKLKLEKGSSTKYAGTFVDHVGGKATKASADATEPGAPRITLKATNGEFRFRGASAFGGGTYFDATGTKVPSRLGVKAKEVYLTATKHSVRTSTYNVTFSERSGPINRPTEYAGTMTLAYDALNRVSGGQVTVTNRKGRNVTSSIENTGYVSSTYFYAVVKVDTVSMGLSGTINASGFNGFGFSGSGTKTTQWVVTGTP